MPTIRRVKAREAQAGLSELLRVVEAESQRIVIERYTRPVAAMVSMRDLQQLDALNHGRSMKRIALSNISGGETKTTLTLNLAAWYARAGLRVAVVDLDPQASLTKFLGLHLDPSDPAWTAEATVLGVLSGRGDLPSPIRKFGMDIWPSNEFLNDAVPRLMQGVGFGRLREATAALDYDVMLLDTMPGMGPLLIASLAASDHVLVPVNSIKGLQNFEPLAQMITEARAWSPELSVGLFIPSGLQGHLNYHKALMETLADYSDIAPVAGRVREAKRLIGEQSFRHQPAVLLEPNSGYAEDIALLAGQIADLTGFALPVGASS